MVQIDEQSAEILDFFLVLFLSMSLTQCREREGGGRKQTCSGFTLMMPTNSRKFRRRDFAIRFKMRARSVCFPFPLFEVGVKGGV